MDGGFLSREPGAVAGPVALSRVVVGVGHPGGQPSLRVLRSFLGQVGPLSCRTLAHRLGLRLFELGDAALFAAEGVVSRERHPLFGGLGTDARWLVPGGRETLTFRVGPVAVAAGAPIVRGVVALHPGDDTRGCRSGHRRQPHDAGRQQGWTIGRPRARVARDDVERSGGSVPAVAPSELLELAERRGPFLSVYLTTEVAVDNAAQLSERRWKSVRRELAHGGAPQRCLAVVDDLVPDAHLEGSALGAVISATGRPQGARGGESSNTFVDHDAEPLARDIASWSAVPVLTPAIAWRQHEPPYVCAMVDRTGADLLAVSRDEPPTATSAGADRWPVSKAHSAGAPWRCEHRVEENWARNERQVAAELERMVDALGARLVAVAGDERAIGLLREAVPDRLAGMVVTVTGSGAAESGNEDLGADVARWVHTVESRDTVATLDALHARVRSGRAVEGADATFAALRESRVDVLVLHDSRLVPQESDDGERSGPDGARRAGDAWFDPTTPELCAAARTDLVELGVERPSDGPLVDVAVRAALLSGAGVRLVPAHGGPQEGIGALLRWSE